MAASDPSWAKANLDKLEPMLSSAQMSALQDNEQNH
jgi:hypothetical protein